MNIEEITLTPVMGFIPQHVEPMEHDLTGIVPVNICSGCHSIGASNFFDDTCEFCGSVVNMETRQGKWIPNTEVVITRTWYGAKRYEHIPRSGGTWKLVPLSK